eukprot:4560060-Pyramimonas_sp.AAC.1
MTERVAVAEMLASLEADLVDAKTFTDCVTSLSKWFKCCRNATVLPVMQAYFKANEVFLDRAALASIDEQ